MIITIATKSARVEVKRRGTAARGAHLAHLEALVDASSQAIMSADASGMITTWNRGAEALYGYTEAEITGMPVSALCPPEGITEQRRLLQAAARGQVGVEVDTRRVHKNGSRLDVWVTISRLMEAGSLIGFCAMAHDIRERVRSSDELEEKVRKGTRALFRSRAETLHGLALAAEYRDHDTAHHTERVGENAARLAAWLGLPARLVKLIGHAAPLHDVGKIGIPDQILLKSGTLTAAEFDAIKQHTILGSRLLEGSDGEILQLGEQIAMTHHERWDGKGYPAGLAGVAIPIAGRITAVVDTFDALTHERPYRSACSVDEALTKIARCSGSQFDPRVVDAFLQMHHLPSPRTTSRHRGGPYREQSASVRLRKPVMSRETVSDAPKRHRERTSKIPSLQT